MIFISKLATGILLQRDGTELVIDQAAIASTLPHVIGALTDCARIASQARSEGFQDGIVVGRERERIERETSMRIADRQADELVQALVGLGAMASAA